MQTSSNVYEFDICLSRLQKFNQIIARYFRDFGKHLGHRRPPLKAYTSVLNLQERKRDLLDREIQIIEARWKHFSFLRGLYVDDLVSRDFETYRARFASSLKPKARTAIADKSLSDDSIEKSHFNHSQFEQNKRFGPEFKARFHRSLCLHSLTILGLHFGKISSDQPSNDGVDPANESQKFANEVKESLQDLCRKTKVVAGGKTINLDRDTRIDCLEIHDFLYLFILDKMIPYERLASWIGKDASAYPYCWWAIDTDTRDAFAIDGWDKFLSTCRWALQPHDLAQLIQNRAWVGDNTYPPDKVMYMQVRGIFESGDGSEADWVSLFLRNKMALELHCTPELEFVNDVEPCWWDGLRVRLGSPFLLNAIPTYIAEIGELERAARESELATLEIVDS